ncbi:hypothetical protein [Streptomyces hainanensis]|uniref:DUF1963 domain-containing protein n=1 Tax=Streptomyces hainanensis TaxID=402648 RepID=A0A4R4TJX6_9ACTN|nr:hypothetical protein [Streptomyces hainanensis]TDC78020.1 hypothetical protein E1283_05985 [Streptomyces hainanensis]
MRNTGVTELGDLPRLVPGVTFRGLGETPAAEPQAGDAGAPPEPTVPLPEREAAALSAEFAAVGSGDHRRRRRLERALLAGLAPGFVTALHDRALGLALLTTERGEPALAYLCWAPDDRGDGVTVEPPGGLERFADPALGYHLSVVVGSAPRHVEPTATVPAPAGPVPRPVRDLSAVHHHLVAPHDARVGGDLSYNMLGFFSDDGWRAVSERLGWLPPDRFVVGVGSSDFSCFLLDLDVLDAAGNPTVVNWALKEWELGGHQQFWDWLDTTGAGELLRS